MNIEDQMLSTLLGQYEEPDSMLDDADDIPIDEQKRLLKRDIEHLSVEDRKHIGNVLVMNNLRSHLRQCTAGTVINLDALPDYVIRQMYDLMTYKLNARN